MLLNIFNMVLLNLAHRAHRSKPKYICKKMCYQKMISRPTRIPVMAEKAGSLLWYIRMA